MPRPLSSEFVNKLQDVKDDSSVGMRLAKVCMDANLHLKYVAVALEVSRMTVYSWSRGGKIRNKKLPLIETFIRLVKEDMEAGVLPAKSLKASKEYIGSMIGTSI